jgi:hypothetical protein
MIDQSVVKSNHLTVLILSIDRFIQLIKKVYSPIFAILSIFNFILVIYSPKRKCSQILFSDLSSFLSFFVFLASSILEEYYGS